MDNKSIFIDWLTRFKKKVNSANFKSIDPYLNYLSTVEKHLAMKKDALYALNNKEEIQELEESLKRKKSFKALKNKYQSNLLSAVHMYESFVELMMPGNTI